MAELGHLDVPTHCNRCSGWGNFFFFIFILASKLNVIASQLIPYALTHSGSGNAEVNLKANIKIPNLEEEVHYFRSGFHWLLCMRCLEHQSPRAMQSALPAPSPSRTLAAGSEKRRRCRGLCRHIHLVPASAHCAMLRN